MRFSSTYLILFLTLFFFSPTVFSQKLPESENDTLIMWSKDRKLTSNDFVKTRLEGNKAAQSDIAIDVITRPVEGKYKNYVLVYFLKLESTIETITPDIIRHEQFHFNIAELYGRKIRKKLVEITKGSIDKTVYKESINKIYDEYFQYQNRYDKETNHSINKQAQINWEKKIAKELQELNSFRSRYY